MSVAFSSLEKLACSWIHLDRLASSKNYVWQTIAEEWQWLHDENAVSVDLELHLDSPKQNKYAKIMYIYIYILISLSYFTSSVGIVTSLKCWKGSSYRSKHSSTVKNWSASSLYSSIFGVPLHLVMQKEE